MDIHLNSNVISYVLIELIAAFKVNTVEPLGSILKLKLNILDELFLFLFISWIAFKSSHVRTRIILLRSKVSVLENYNNNKLNCQNLINVKVDIIK